MLLKQPKPDLGFRPDWSSYVIVIRPMGKSESTITAFLCIEFFFLDMSLGYVADVIFGSQFALGTEK